MGKSRDITLHILCFGFSPLYCCFCRFLMYWEVLRNIIQGDYTPNQIYPLPPPLRSETGVIKCRFLCHLICQSDNFMSSLCGVCVCLRICVRVNNFSSKTARPRDMFFFFKKIPYLSRMKNYSRHADLFVCLLEPLEVRYPLKV